MSKVALNSFIKRQVENSPFAHFRGDWSELLNLIEINLSAKELGDKKGSWLVPMPPALFMSSVTPFFPGVQVKTEFKPRREGEEPFLDITVPGSKIVAQCAHVVVYEHWLLGNEAETDAEFEAIAILASPTETRTPTDPVTMARNYLERPGGTKAEYSSEEWATSILYWSQNGKVSPK